MEGFRVYMSRVEDQRNSGIKAISLIESKVLTPGELPSLKYEQSSAGGS